MTTRYYAVSRAREDAGWELSKIATIKKYLIDRWPRLYADAEENGYMREFRMMDTRKADDNETNIELEMAEEERERCF